MGGFTLSFIDNSKETAAATFNGADLTAANFDAQIALQDALIAAAADIVMGNQWKLERMAEQERASMAPPVSKEAQREKKWSVLYEDTTTYKRYTVSLPCADLSKLAANSDDADLEEEDVAAFKTAFEAYQLSPDGNAVNILMITYTGRRS